MNHNIRTPMKRVNSTSVLRTASVDKSKFMSNASRGGLDAEHLMLAAGIHGFHKKKLIETSSS